MNTANDRQRLAERINHSGQWKRALVPAVPVSIVVLGLFYYWFAVADRYFIFLYYHDMGHSVPDTSPFSPVTSSRYWMAGLVASGVVLALYVAINWLVGRLSAGYYPPEWWRVWVLSAGPLAIGIPAITMTVNQPTLPLSNALQATLVILAGLSLALLPGEMAARRPSALFWLGMDGWGLMLVMVAAIGVERLPRWQASDGVWWVRIMVLMLVLGLGWLLVVTGLRYLFRTPVPGTVTLFLAGLCVAYLVMPLLHHVVGTDGQFYITNSNNFLADNVALQVVIWLLTAGLCWAITHLRQILVARRVPSRVSA